MSLKPILATISFCLALLLLIFFVGPRFQEHQILNEKIKQTDQELQQTKDYVSKMESVNNELSKRETSVNKAKSALPPEPGLSSLLNFLVQTGDDAGLSLESVGSIESGTFENDIETIQANIVLNGTYTSFRDFLRVVEKSSRLIEVKTLSFSAPKTKAEQEETLPSFELGIMAHYLP